MNSLQGGWGIQDRHDRVISWLSAIVVSLLVLYALIFFGRQVMPSGPQRGGTPVASAEPRGPIPPIQPRPTPIPTRNSVIPTRRGRLPGVSPSPTEVTSPTREATRPLVTGLPVPPPTEATRTPVLPPQTRPALPVPTRIASSRPAPAGNQFFIVRIGNAFGGGVEALSFARNYDLTRFSLTPASEEPGASLYLDVGPFRTQEEAFREMSQIKTRIGDPNARMTIRPVDAGTSDIQQPPTPIPTRNVVVPPVTRPSIAPVTRRPPPTERATRPPVATRRPLVPTATREVIPTPPTRRPRDLGPPGFVAPDTVSMSREDAEELLRTRYGWTAPTISGYTLQVSSFRSLVNAVNFQQHLQRKGYQAELEVVDLQGAWFRILVDQFASIQEARLAADRFLARHGDSYQVLVRKR